MQTETLTGTERITMVIGDGDNKSPNGTQLGQWKTIYETSTDNPLPTAPTASDAVLMIDGVGLIALPGTHGDLRLHGRRRHVPAERRPGHRCGGQPWGPRSQQNYLFPAGQHAVSLHLATPDCTATSPYPDTTVDLKAGQRAFLFYFTPDDRTLKSLLVPVQ